MKKWMICLMLAMGAIAIWDCNKEKKEKAAVEDQTGMPGDNFDLYATLDVFKNSKSPEDFERNLNSKSQKVNNLDLNGDSTVDYLRVIDEKKDDAHMIIIRDPLNDKESQDVAVIEISKTSDKTAHLQIIGDESLYGKDFIVEPKAESNSAGFVMVTNAVALNVWDWPVVSYVYSPDYVVYVSPYTYAYYPEYYDPWPVVTYEVYEPAVVEYRTYYYRPDGYRFVSVHETYAYHVRQSSTNIYLGPKRGWANGRRPGPPMPEGASYGPRGKGSHPFDMKETHQREPGMHLNKNEGRGHGNDKRIMQPRNEKGNPGGEKRMEGNRPGNSTLEKNNNRQSMKLNRGENRQQRRDARQNKTNRGSSSPPNPGGSPQGGKGKGSRGPR